MNSEKPLFGAFAGSVIRPPWTRLLLLFGLLAILTLRIFSTDTVFPVRWITGLRGADDGSSGLSDFLGDERSCVGFFGPVPRRKVVMSIADFGGVGDGRTSNTESFRRAVRYMQSFGDKGGSQLNVPKGSWLTGSFNLTSNFTLFLEEGAVILGSQARLQYN